VDAEVEETHGAAGQELNQHRASVPSLRRRRRRPKKVAQLNAFAS
jgi:hypothetical protein